MGKSGNLDIGGEMMSEFESLSKYIIDVSSVDVPQTMWIMNFIHDSYKPKPPRS